MVFWQKLYISAVIANIIMCSVLLIVSLGDGLISFGYFVTLCIWFITYLFSLKIFEER